MGGTTLLDSYLYPSWDNPFHDRVGVFSFPFSSSFQALWSTWEKHHHFLTLGTVIYVDYTVCYTAWHKLEDKISNLHGDSSLYSSGYWNFRNPILSYSNFTSMMAGPVTRRWILRVSLVWNQLYRIYFYNPLYFYFYRYLHPVLSDLEACMHSKVGCPHIFVNLQHHRYSLWRRLQLTYSFKLEI